MAHSEQQASWLNESVGVYLTSDQVVRVVGEDGPSWLNGQVTADVRELASDTATYALAASLKGRVQTDLWALATEEGLVIVLPALCRAQALEAFEKHIIMEDVELVQDAQLRVVTLQGPKARELVERAAPVRFHYACQRLPPRPGYDLWIPEAELPDLLASLARVAGELDGGLVDDAGWELAHIALGVPRAGIDFGLQSYPQEAGLKARAVSFNKGCYTGQEVVYMLEKRGQVARRLVQLVGPPSPPATGEAVHDEAGQRIGEVTSAACRESQGISLAYVKRAFAEPGKRVQIQGTPWEVRCVLGEHDAGCPIVASA